jgi:hypothetical protein
MIGQQFGNWTVIKESEIKPQNHRGRFFQCICACGSESIVRGDQLKSGRSSGCKACYEVRFKKIVTTHGRHTNPSYSVWRGIRRRCKEKNHPSYRYYGAKGITYCERWESFENFFNDMGEKPEGFQIDRINNEGNYEPSNCRWVTFQENLEKKYHDKLKRQAHQLSFLANDKKDGVPLHGNIR